MKIENEFTVPAPIDEAWALLTDIPAIAPCLPGAKLTSSDGGRHVGQITVKVGPVTAQYVGTAELVAKDDGAHRAEIDARGRDKRGAGTAQAHIAAVLVPVGNGTRVAIDTDLHISGKVAQFGRGMMVDVSQKLLGQFADCLEGKLADRQAPALEEPAVGAAGAEPPTGDAPAEAAPRASAPQGRPTDDGDVAPLDLVGLAGGAVARRLVPIAIAVVVAVILYIVLR